jgi:7-keto-8-aminopelargonate synthetase-like enzyme
VHIGRLDDEDVLRVNQAVLVFLGLATSPKIKQAGIAARREGASICGGSSLFGNGSIF